MPLMVEGHADHDRVGAKASIQSVISLWGWSSPTCGKSQAIGRFGACLGNTYGTWGWLPRQDEVEEEVGRMAEGAPGPRSRSLGCSVS